MSKLEIIDRPVATLTPYAGNPRTHTKRQIARIAESIKAFGWTNPILIDDESGIIAGHVSGLGKKTYQEFTMAFGKRAGKACPGSHPPR